MPAGAAEPSLPDLLAALMRREDLTASDTAWAMERILTGETTPVQTAGLMVLLRAKGETVEEVDGLVRAMYQNAVAVSVPGPIVDVVGTGGDRARTVNISTMSAVVAAGAGARVVKHGNRASSSASGAADVLEELGVILKLTPEQIAACVDEVGIAFCFAPLFHPALRNAATARAELAVPTTFNLLGPLANPARPQAQAVGVADGRTAPLVAGVLARRGVSALVFHGEDGLDEISVTGPSRIWDVRDGSVREELFDPRELGIELVELSALRGADAAYNAGVARAVFGGERGPVRDAVLLSAAAALAALHPSEGTVTERLGHWITQAGEAIDSGATAGLLERWVAVTRKLAGS